MDIVEIESCLRIDYTIYDVETNEKLTSASTTQAAVSLSDGLMQFQTPDSWLEAVKGTRLFRPSETASPKPLAFSADIQSGIAPCPGKMTLSAAITSSGREVR